MRPLTRRAFILGGAALAGGLWLLQSGRADPNRGAFAVSAAGVTLGWATDVPCTAWVRYGLGDAYDRATPEEMTATMAHSRELPGLLPGSRYRARAHHRVGGAIVAGEPYEFATTREDGKWH